MFIASCESTSLHSTCHSESTRVVRAGRTDGAHAFVRSAWRARGIHTHTFTWASGTCCATSLNVRVLLPSLNARLLLLTNFFVQRLLVKTFLIGSYLADRMQTGGEGSAVNRACHTDAA